jgi:hypothetical protein
MKEFLISIILGFFVSFLIFISPIDRISKTILLIFVLLILFSQFYRFKIKERNVFIFALIISGSLGALLGQDITIDKEAWHWTFSTIFQGFATIFGLFAIFLVYRLQIIDREIETSIKSLREVVYGGENFSTEDLIKYAKGQIKGLEEDHELLLEEYTDHINKEIVDVELKLNKIKEVLNKHNLKIEFKDKILEGSLETMVILAVILFSSLYLLPVVSVNDTSLNFLTQYRKFSPITLSGFIGASLVTILFILTKTLILLGYEKTD